MTIMNTIVSGGSGEKPRIFMGEAPYTSSGSSVTLIGLGRITFGFEGTAIGAKKLTNYNARSSGTSITGVTVDSYAVGSFAKMGVIHADNVDTIVGASSNSSLNLSTTSYIPSISSSGEGRSLNYWKASSIINVTSAFETSYDGDIKCNGILYGNCSSGNTNAYVVIDNEKNVISSNIPSTADVNMDTKLLVTSFEFL